jgi:hypothetical protein
MNGMQKLRGLNYVYLFSITYNILFVCFYISAVKEFETLANIERRKSKSGRYPKRGFYHMVRSF